MLKVNSSSLFLLGFLMVQYSLFQLLLHVRQLCHFSVFRFKAVSTVFFSVSVIVKGKLAVRDASIDRISCATAEVGSSTSYMPSEMD